MSWYASITIPRGASEGDIDEALERMEVVGNAEALLERDEAGEIAKTAALVLVRAGVVGDIAKTALHVHLCGHANPGNDRRKGLHYDRAAGPDTVTVTVSAVWQEVGK